MPEKKRPSEKLIPATPKKAPAKAASKPARSADAPAAKPPAPRKPAAEGAARGAKTAKPPAARKPSSPKAPSRKPAAATPPSGDGGASLSIVMVASEVHPFAKTGGLAEVLGGLSDGLARLGHRVTVVLPRYRGVQLTGAGEAATLSVGDRTQDVAYHTRDLKPGVKAVLVDAPDLYDRDGLYGTGMQEFGDNAWRFAVLSLAALDYVRRSGARPDVFHAHDWQAGLVPVYQKMLFSADPVVGGVPAVFTIHNIAFQGVFPSGIVDLLGLPRDVLHVDAMEFWGQVSFLKGGVNFSEKITTVSPTYAKETLQSDLAYGFHGILSRRAADFSGILNGIDVERWNPSSDEFVRASFSATDLSGKAEAKRELLRLAGLPADDDAMRRPVIGVISRLTDQKGFDLVAAASEPLMALDATWVMLGSGEPRYEEMWRHFARQHPDRVAATIGFDERLAHHIEAGADLFLMPSRYEPCGLNQLYSLRYGTVPVVRATGGLADTVRDADAADGGTGFAFAEFSEDALVEALERALAAHRNPGRWGAIQRAGMAEDHSWDASAREYVKVYRQARGA